MRASEIVVGRTYTDGKGRERKVLDAQPGYFDYQIVSGPATFVDTETIWGISRSAFARWAKEEVTP